MRTIVIFPGRFQPFGKHHYETYKWAVSKFGYDNVYISTSDTTDERSPLNFEEKSYIIRKFGISKDKICLSDRPYMPVKLLTKFDRDKDRLIIIYGEKDYGRLSFKKKDGTQSFFKRYTGQTDLEPFKDSAYALVAPHVQINHKGNEICGTYLRHILSSCTRKEMFELMGWVDEMAYSIFKRKFQNFIGQYDGTSHLVLEEDQISYDTVDAFKLIFESNTENIGKYTRHISHPHESSMSFYELKKLFFDLTKNTEAIDKCSLKLDGYNLQVTVKNSKVLCSRNKSTVLFPMGYEEVKEKFSNNTNAQYVFCEALRTMQEAITLLDQDSLKIFNNGLTFLNLEVIHDKSLNVFKYSFPALSIHGIITYDQDGNESFRSNSLPKDIVPLLGRSFGEFTIIETPKILIKPTTQGSFFIDRLKLLQNRYKIQESCSINNLQEGILLEIRELVFGFGNHIIRENYKSTDLEGNVNRVVSIVETVYDNLSDSQDILKFNKCISLLDKLGGYKAINPIEGFVLEWNNRTIKITGSFGALVPIFNIWHKKRF